MSNNFYKCGFWVSTTLCVIMLFGGVTLYGAVQRFERKVQAAEAVLSSYKQALEISSHRYERLVVAIKSTLGNTTLKRLLDFIER